MKHRGNDPPWPVTVITGSRRTAVLMNRKAYRKSLENSSPWIVHPVTNRVLPWPGSPAILSLKESPGSYTLTIAEGAELHPYGMAAPLEIDPDDRGEMHEDGTQGKSMSSGILDRLSSIIAEYKKTMPEGSYTAHLFSVGEEKIRKKVGEEVIELLLSHEKDDIIYETADLIYHVQVLLAALDLKWADVENELLRRHTD